MTIRSPLEQAAWALAEATPSYLGRPTTPPLSWRLEGDLLIVVLADGRKVRGPMPIPKPVQAKPSRPVIIPKIITPEPIHSPAPKLVRPKHKKG